MKAGFEAFARGIDEDERVGTQERLVLLGIETGALGAHLELRANAVPAGHEIRARHGLDFEGGRENAAAGVFIEPPGELIGDVRLKAENFKGRAQVFRAWRAAGLLARRFARPAQIERFERRDGMLLLVCRPDSEASFRLCAGSSKEDELGSYAKFVSYMKKLVFFN